MGKYTNVDSSFLKHLIGKTSWKNRDYIDELIMLNEYIINHPTQWASSVHYRMLKEKYQNEYLELLKENSIEKYEKELRRIEEEKEEDERREQKHQNKIQRLKEDWIQAGGKE